MNFSYKLENMYMLMIEQLFGRSIGYGSIPLACSADHERTNLAKEVVNHFF